MTPDPVRTAVRSYVAHLHVPAKDLSTVLAAARSRRGVGHVARRWLVPALAALLVLGFVASTSVVPRLTAPPGAGAGGRPATLPAGIAGYSYLTASVSESPPGRAIALYQHGLGVELGDIPQAVVLSADGDRYRRLDVAEDRSKSIDLGDPAPMLLSPDGHQVAVGGNGPVGDLRLVDLTSGRSSTVRVSSGVAVRPLAYSPDGRRLAVADLGAPNPMTVMPEGGQLVVLDLTGATAPVRLSGLTAVSAASFAPDGVRLAAQQADTITIVDLNATEPVIHRITDVGVLTGPTAWSPFGETLAVRPRSTNTVMFVRADGPERPTPTPLPGGSNTMEWLGWRAPDRGLVIDNPGGPPTLVELDLTTGTRTSLSTFDTGPAANYLIARVQLASALLSDLQIREPTSPDRGPWPTWLTITVALLLSAAATVALLIFRRLRRR
jgi:hypothetical protein